MAEHIQVTGADAGVGVAFARGKVRQLRVLGLNNVSKTFKFLGFTVFIRINGPDEYIWVKAGALIAFHTKPHYAPLSPPDDSKGDYCVITTQSGDTAAANKETFYERVKQKAGTHSWVSEDGKHLVTWNGPKKLRIHYPGGAYEEPQPSGGYEVYVAGEERKTTHPVTAAAMFSGKTVYAVVPHTLGAPGSVDIRVEGNYGTENDDELVAHLEIPSATVPVVSGYIPHTLGGVAGISSTEFPIQATGIAKFSPDGKQLFVLCQPFGPALPDGPAPWHAYAPVRVFEVALRVEDEKIRASAAFTSLLGEPPEYEADREYTMVPGTTDPTEAYWVSSETSGTSVRKELSEVVGLAVRKVQDRYVPVAVTVELSQHSVSMQEMSASEGPPDGGGGFYMPYRTASKSVTDNTFRIVVGDQELFSFPAWRCETSTSSDVVYDFPHMTLVSGYASSQVDTLSRVVELRAIDPDTMSLVVAIHEDRKTGAAHAQYEGGEEVSSDSDLNMQGTVGFHLIRGGESAYSNVRVGGIPPGGVYSGGLDRVFKSDQFPFIRYIDRNSFFQLGQPDVLTSAKGVVMAYINSECALGVSSLDYIAGAPNELMNRVFAFENPLPADGAQEGVLVVSRKKPLPRGAVKDLTPSTEVVGYTTKTFSPITLGVKPPRPAEPTP